MSELFCVASPFAEQTYCDRPVLNQEAFNFLISELTSHRESYYRTCYYIAFDNRSYLLIVKSVKTLLGTNGYWSYWIGLIADNESTKELIAMLVTRYQPIENIRKTAVLRDNITYLIYSLCDKPLYTALRFWSISQDSYSANTLHWQLSSCFQKQVCSGHKPQVSLLRWNWNRVELKYPCAYRITYKVMDSTWN
jgi:hypothetical protein